ncbi:MAG: hypothetical protein MJ195_03245 [Mycoplasmoidaceae bacterium]|nr:hypothetical protein [Mycoplasmoidaceae bacterium]
MKNLIKNVVRSFKNNKLSIIGLVLLLFFGLGVFCVMSNTTSNIKNEYTSLAQRGNLHDFTVSELYDVGKAEYRAEDTVAISFDVAEHTTSNFTVIENIGDENIPVSQFFFDSDLTSPKDGTYYIPMPEQIISPAPGVGGPYYC